MNPKSKPTSYGRCDSCRIPLLQSNGYAGTHLCGPCCTGEADTLLDTTVLCPTHGYAQEVSGRCSMCAAGIKP